MQENYLYEYAVIRFLPKVEREEFVNVGIILFSKKAKFIQTKCFLNLDKIRLFSSEVDIDVLAENLDAFQRISQGDKTAGRIALMDIPERFRWLTAVRSASIQTSRPHPGFSDDLDKTVDKLFAELVL